MAWRDWIKDPELMRREYAGLSVWNWLAVFVAALVILLTLGLVFQ
jgi:hypothetical protein